MNLSCRASSITLCVFQEAYTREITLDGLEPYTFYVIHGAVSNYYSVYSATSLGEATVIRTRPGGEHTNEMTSVMQKGTFGHYT